MTGSRFHRTAGALALVLAVGACGGEEEGGAPPPPPTEAAPPAGGRPARGAATGANGQPIGKLQVYPKVEDVVPEAERATIRHPFRDRDFMGDPTGSENRDPFRSFVINQPGLIFDTGNASEQTDTCSKQQLVATQFSMRDLRLVGIVSRGTKRFALFQDNSDLGHIVSRGDCLGKEKAHVKDIGVGFVTLELVPDQAPGQPPRAAEERSIPLYPEELPISVESEAPEVAPSQPPPSLPMPSAP